MSGLSSSEFIYVKPSHNGQKVTAICLVLALLYVVYAFWKGQIAWEYVEDNLFTSSVLNGVLNMIIMTFLSMVLGIALGTITAVVRMSDNKVLRAAAGFYIWLFRGTPALLQLLLWFNLALIFPTISLFGFFPIQTVDVMTPFVAALVGLGVQQGAYTAEVVRAGILSIDKGQLEAAQSIGMTRSRAMLRIILPQAMRVIVPPIGNETIGMVKLTSLASVIQYAEVLRSVENIYYANSRVIELLIVAAIWYLVVVTVLNIGQFYLERYFSRGWGIRKVKVSASKTASTELVKED